jgi:CTP:molybdopterin cytidylyltransferase MocA
MTAAIVLAAGASTRLGRPKQLLVLDGETLVHRAARVALEAGSSPVVVVEGAVPLGDALRGLAVELVPCADWAKGPGASLRAGVLALRGRADAVLVTLVDQPDVGVPELRSLLDAPGEVVAAQYSGVLGVPAVFRGAHVGALASLPPERGAGAWLKAHAEVVTAIPLPEAALDVDSPADAETLARRSHSQ